jgi:hypothetical protein
MEPSEEDIKEVYARFGLAYYMGEVLHRGLCNIYVGLRTPDDGATRLRIEELMREAYAETLGGVLNRVRNALSKDLESQLLIAVEKRNYLAHRFWFEKVHMLSSAEGAHAVVEQLAEAIALFDHINKNSRGLHWWTFEGSASRTKWLQECSQKNHLRGQLNRCRRSDGRRRKNSSSPSTMLQ